jgi:L-seryl-tRNA(Ser) seleniumtransferase
MANTIPTTAGDPRRELPAVSLLLELPRMRALISAFSHVQVVEALRTALQACRSELKPGDAVPTPEVVAERAAILLLTDEADRLRPVINATGVILHTGLGRAVLPRRAAQSLARLDHCVNLQIDMATGLRGKRNAGTEHLLCRLTGAAAALVVNNNAAATMLVLAALCTGREVIVSRGQLIEIGGSYRLPDCIHQAGARLVEVGTTNKTHLRDYRAALTEATAAVLHVNPSNYRIVGFSKTVPIEELATLKHERPDLLVIDDLGCGALIDLEQFGLPHEPTAPEAIAAGADLCLFSGDKLIGGPQAGCIVGSAELIGRIRKHPLTRMLRVDKLTDLALEQTLRLFLSPATLMDHNPTLRMLTLPSEMIRRRALRLKRLLLRRTAERLMIEVVEGTSAVGGGSLPATPIPTWLLSILATNRSPTCLLKQLRDHEPPVIARIENDRVVIDLRTVLEDEEAALMNALIDA